MVHNRAHFDIALFELFIDFLFCMRQCFGRHFKIRNFGLALGANFSETHFYAFGHHIDFPKLGGMVVDELKATSG